jgi:signal transduction histidine kinase
MKQQPTIEELIAGNKELSIKNEQNEKRIAEQSVLLQKLEERNAIMEKEFAGLKNTNQQLIIRDAEREKLSIELGIAYKKLKKADDYLKEYIKGLEEMMHMTSHRVRKPVANILGIANIISNFINSPVHLKKMVSYLKTSATTLDAFTKELTEFIYDLEQKGRNQD